MFRLDNKVALITGGARGLGLYIAQTYAEAGANVVICSRNGEACKRVAKEIANKYDIEAIGLTCDVTNNENVEQLVKEAIQQLGKIDILVNNSGASWAAPVEEMPIEAWYKVMNVNVTGTFLMSQTVGRQMIKQQSGKIINIASVAGFGGTPSFMNTIGYNTSKGAIITFTKDLAVKWGKHNINVNAIAPGFFPTKMSKGLIDHAEKFIIDKTPLRRLGTDQDLKGPALFFASTASDYITGTILAVDGGTSAF